MGSSKGVTFLRDATGLVRQVGAFDSWIYGVMAISLGFGIALVFTLGPATFPGGSILLAIAIFAALMIFKDFLYAQMGTAMPRSGGEYVFQARSMSFMSFWPIGNQISYNVLWQGCIYQSLTATAIGTFAIIPLLYSVGLVTSNAGMLSAAVWLGTPIGTYVTILVIAGISIMIAAFSIKFYMEKFQRTIFVVGMIQIAVIFWLLLTSDQATFISRFNTFAQPFFNQADSYHYVISQAQSLGLGTEPFWIATIGLMAFIAFGLIWSHWIIHNFGEVKKAGDLKLYSWVFIGGTLFCAAITLALAEELIRVCGMPFLTAIGYLAFMQPQAYLLPVQPFHTFLVGILTTSVPVLVIINVGMICWCIQPATNIDVGMSRLVLALAFDRILPAKLGEVSDRFHTPLNALLFFYIVGAVIMGALVAFLGFAAAFTGAVLAQIFSYATSGLAGVLFPYVRKEVFKASPSAKWMIGPIPFVTICGLVTFIGQALLFWAFFAVPGVGITDPRALGVVFALIIGSIIYYEAVKAYRKSQGMDLNLLLTSIPPE
ncbi:MAG TPA: amino acid permease [Candidatus Saccharimonadales bacterium]|nr:amino acid permease [Candidatus Saccharimonadales bacterium]